MLLYLYLSFLSTDFFILLSFYGGWSCSAPHRTHTHSNTFCMFISPATYIQIDIFIVVASCCCCPCRCCCCCWLLLLIVHCCCWWWCWCGMQSSKHDEKKGRSILLFNWACVCVCVSFFSCLIASKTNKKLIMHRGTKVKRNWEICYIYFVVANFEIS